MMEEAGCEVWYLPSYLPDRNQIERYWSWLKSRIRHQLKNFDTLRDAIENFLHLAGVYCPKWTGDCCIMIIYGKKIRSR